MNLLATGGLGDFIAILQHVHELPQTLYVASPRAGEIGELCHHLNIPIKIIECHKTYYFACQVFSMHGDFCPGIVDGSISAIFPQIMAGNMKFQRHLFSGLKFPRQISGEYTLVCPASMNVADRRNFTGEELNWIMDNTSGQIVVCNKGTFPIKKHARVIDMSNKTSMMESLGLIYHAAKVISIDTWTATAAASMKKAVLVKSVNPDFWHHKSVYLSPLRGNVTLRQYLI